MMAMNFFLLVISWLFDIFLFSDVLVRKLKVWKSPWTSSIFFFYDCVTQTATGDFWIVLKSPTAKSTNRDVDDALISGHESRRLQNTKGGLSSGAAATGCTGERCCCGAGCCWLWGECCRKDPWRGGIMDSMPRDEGLRRLLGTWPMLADGDGTFFHLWEEVEIN